MSDVTFARSLTRYEEQVAREEAEKERKETELTAKRLAQYASFASFASFTSQGYGIYDRMSFL